MVQSLLALLVISAAVVSGADAFAAERGRQSRVLILYSNERLLPANIVADAAIRATFAAGTDKTVEFYNEFLDIDRFPGGALQERVRDFLRDKYSERPPDLIIAGGGEALAFLLKYRATVFTEVPVVHCAVSSEELSKMLPDERVVGVPLVPDAGSTLELALRLQPDTRQVAVVGRGIGMEPQGSDELSEEFSQFEKRVTFTWLTNRSLPELRRELARLPDHTVVLYGAMFRDPAGNTFTPRAALAEFAPASRVPIYGYYDTYLGYGIVGGSMVTFEAIGRVAAKIGLRILAGENPQAAARMESHQPVPMFDWRQLRRWNISEKRLPSDSVVQFRPPTLWENYKYYVIGVLCIIVAQAATIAALLAQRARRRRAETVLHEREQDMQLAAAAAKLALWTWDIPRNFVRVTPKGHRSHGSESLGEPSLEHFLDTLHSEDRAMVREAVNRSLHGDGEYGAEYRVLTSEGAVRWMAARGKVEFNDHRQPLRMRGVSLDITERKLAEFEVHQRREEVAHLARVTTLGEISGSLAHELNQPLAAILANTETAEMHLQHQVPNLAEVRNILADIRKDDLRASEIILGIRAFLRRHELEIQPLELGQLAGEAVKLIRADAAARQTTVGIEINPDLPRVAGDSIHLQQVLLNLLVNGMDAMSTCPVADRRITIRAMRLDPKNVEIAVRDAGVGIPPEDGSRVFEPFHTTKRGGLGLGLAICRSIVDAHGGSISVANNSDRGATAKFTLRVAALEVAA